MVNSYNYNILMQKLRSFFQIKKGFIEVPAHSRLSILASCNDPKTSTFFAIEGTEYPLPQTGHLWLDYELLKNPQWNGVFCIGPSYKDHAIEGKRQQIAPLFEFAAKGTFEELKKIEIELLSFLGFEKPYSISHQEVCSLYGIETIEQNNKTMLFHEFGPSISLEQAPSHYNTFWNMKRNTNNYFNKVDILLFGLETIESAERATNKEEMRNLFYTISSGSYATELCKKFGKDRILSELDDYLTLPMFERFSGSVNISALEHAFKKAHLFELHAYQPTRSATMPQTGNNT